MNVFKFLAFFCLTSSFVQVQAQIFYPLYSIIQIQINKHNTLGVAAVVIKDGKIIDQN
jgi:hypothetical protein